MADDFEHQQREQRWQDHDNAKREKLATTDTRPPSNDGSGSSSGGCLGVLIIGGIVGSMFFGSGDVEDVDIEKNHVRITHITFNAQTREACTKPKNVSSDEDCFNVMPGRRLVQVCNGYALSVNSIRWNKAICTEVRLENNMSKKMISYHLTYDSKSHNICGVFKGDISQSFKCRKIKPNIDYSYVCRGYITNKNGKGCTSILVKSPPPKYNCYGKIFRKQNKEKTCTEVEQVRSYSNNITAQS